MHKYDMKLILISLKHIKTKFQFSYLNKHILTPRGLRRKLDKSSLFFSLASACVFECS